MTDNVTVDPEAAARLRLIEALEEMRAAAKALGLDVAAIEELHAPLAVRADAWCWRVEQLLTTTLTAEEVAA